jgi:hypothetical protein
MPMSNLGTFSNAVYRAVYAGRQLAQVSGGRLLGRKSRFRKDLWERRTLGAEAETVHSIPAAVRKSPPQRSGSPRARAARPGRPGPDETIAGPGTLPAGPGRPAPWTGERGRLCISSHQSRFTDKKGLEVLRDPLCPLSPAWKGLWNSVSSAAPSVSPPLPSAPLFSPSLSS